MRLRRHHDTDGVAWSHLAAFEDDGHDAGLADEFSVVVTRQYRRHQAGLETIQLGTRIPQAGHLDHRRIPQVQPRADRQPEEINAAGGDILTHLPGGHGKARVPQFVKQLGMNEMHLAPIGLARVVHHPRAMFDPLTHVRITLGSKSGQKPDAFLILLAESVHRVTANGRHDPIHSSLCFCEYGFGKTIVCFAGNAFKRPLHLVAFSIGSIDLLNFHRDECFWAPSKDDSSMAVPMIRRQLDFAIFK